MVDNFELVEFVLLAVHMMVHTTVDMNHMNHHNNRYHLHLRLHHHHHHHNNVLVYYVLIQHAYPRNLPHDIVYVLISCYLLHLLVKQKIYCNFIFLYLRNSHLPFSLPFVGLSSAPQANAARKPNSVSKIILVSQSMSLAAVDTKFFC